MEQSKKSDQIREELQKLRNNNQDSHSVADIRSRFTGNSKIETSEYVHNKNKKKSITMDLEELRKYIVDSKDLGQDSKIEFLSQWRSKMISQGSEPNMEVVRTSILGYDDIDDVRLTESEKADWELALGHFSRENFPSDTHNHNHMPIENTENYSSNEKQTENVSTVYGVEAPRRRSVAEIRAQFKGDSLIETQDEVFHRLMEQSKLSRQRREITYDDMQAVRMFDQMNKRIFVESWKEYMQSNNEVIHSNSVFDFLMSYNISESSVDSDQWTEWCNVIADSDIVFVEEDYEVPPENTNVLQTVDSMEQIHYLSQTEIVPPPPPPPPPPRRQSAVPNTVQHSTETTYNNSQSIDNGAVINSVPQSTMQSSNNLHVQVEPQTENHSNNITSQQYESNSNEVLSPMSALHMKEEASHKEDNLQQADEWVDNDANESLYSIDDMEFEERLSLEYQSKRAPESGRTKSKNSNRTTSTNSSRLHGSSNNVERKSLNVTRDEAFRDSTSSKKAKSDGCCCTIS
jgi:hypothetical protein